MTKHIWKRIAALGLCACLSIGAALPLMGAAHTVQAADSGVSGNHVPAGEPEPAPTCFCDVRCTETTPNVDCIICAADVSDCTGKEAEPEPAPVCNCTDKCAAGPAKADCPVCQADVTACAGKEPEPAPACFCDVKCTDTTPNVDCIVCAADVSGCTGKEAEPEPAPVCNCTDKCAAGSAKADCPVCQVDVAACTGKALEPTPACICTSKCETGKVNADCPICKTDLTGCTGKAPDPIPASGVTIAILPPSGWHTKEADATIRVTDDAGNGFSSVKVRVEKNGNWQDITDDLEKTDNRHTGTVEISENCTVYVTVTGHDGQAFEKSRYIECFDRTAPTLRAAVDGRLLRAEADDDLSGVDAIYVDGERYTDMTNGTLDVRLRDLEDDFEQITVQAVDEAGNKSKTVQVKNPEYREPEDDKDDNKAPDTPQCPEPSGKPEPTTPTTPTTPTAPTTPPAAITPPTTTAPGKLSTGEAAATGGTSGGATITKPSASASADPEAEPDTEPRDPVPLTPDGQATVVDNATGEDGKEFFTFTTPSDNTFYLVIDRQRDSENVYFLNAVTEDDLLALAQPEEKEPEVSAVPEPEPVCSCKEQCVPGEVNTACPVCVLAYKDCTGKAPVPEEPETEKPGQSGGAGTIIFILIAALAVGGAGYYFKIYKPKRELDDAEDFDEITGAEEETVNEDEDIPQEAYPQEDGMDEPEEPDYPDYPDEYGDEPEERG